MDRLKTRAADRRARRSRGGAIDRDDQAGDDADQVCEARTCQYLTVPVFSANRVKSRPMPTFGPGWNDRADLANQDVAGEDLLAGEAA